LKTFKAIPITSGFLFLACHRIDSIFYQALKKSEYTPQQIRNYALQHEAYHNYLPYFLIFLSLTNFPLNEENSS